MQIYDGKASSAGSGRCGSVCQPENDIDGNAMNEMSTLPRQRDHHLLRRFVWFALGFWTGTARKSAWLFSLGFLGCLIANMMVAVGFNQWNKFFFDALQLGDQSALQWSVVFLVILAICAALAATLGLQARMRLQLHWRRWVTEALISGWLQHRSIVQSESKPPLDNPEARIADDGRLAVDLSVDLAGGVINTIFLSMSLIFVLWFVGGSIIVSGIEIQGYFVFAVFLYSMISSSIMYRIGCPLIRCMEEKSAHEGDFRYALVQVRQASWINRLRDDDDAARRELERSFAALAQRWVNIIQRQTRMTLLTSTNNLLAPTIPLFLGAPKFLSGSMTLGDLMQVAAAFLQVYAALNWLADNALSLAAWSASARRVAALELTHQRGNWGSEPSPADAADGTDLLLVEREGKL